MNDEDLCGTSLTADASVSVSETPQLPHDATYSVGVTDESAAEIMDAFAELASVMDRESESRAITRVVAAVRADTLTIVNDAITEKFTPALNTGTAMDMLILVGETLRELRAVFGNATRPVSEASGSVPSEAQKKESEAP